MPGKGHLLFSAPYCTFQPYFVEYIALNTLSTRALFRIYVSVLIIVIDVQFVLIKVFLTFTSTFYLLATKFWNIAYSHSLVSDWVYIFSAYVYGVKLVRDALIWSDVIWSKAEAGRQMEILDIISVSKLTVPHRVWLCFIRLHEYFDSKEKNNWKKLFFSYFFTCTLGDNERKISSWYIYSSSVINFLVSPTLTRFLFVLCHCTYFIL